MCDDEDDLAEEVYVTVIHELAHAAGIDDDRLHELGWAMTGRTAGSPGRPRPPCVGSGA